MRTGVAGWHKRINRNYRNVTRSAQLNDGITLDPNRDAIGLMHQAARKAVINRSNQRIGRDLGSVETMLTSGGHKQALPQLTSPGFVASGTSTSAADPGEVLLLLVF